MSDHKIQRLAVSYGLAPLTSGRAGFDTVVVISTCDKLGVNSGQTLTTLDLTVYMYTEIIGAYAGQGKNNRQLVTVNIGR